MNTNVNAKLTGTVVVESPINEFAKIKHCLGVAINAINDLEYADQKGFYSDDELRESRGFLMRMVAAIDNELKGVDIR